MDKTKRLETVLTIVLALVIIYWFKRWNVLLLCAISIGIAALLIPAVASGIHWFWMKLSHVMGAVSGRVILTLIYLLVLLPLAMLARIFGKSNFRLKVGGTTYFKERNHTYTKEDMMHPW